MLRYIMWKRYPYDESLKSVVTKEEVAALEESYAKESEHSITNAGLMAT